MFVDTTFACSTAEMVHKLRSLQFHRYLQRPIFGGSKHVIFMKNCV